MNSYIHSVVLDESKCTGCTTCMKHCPTEAIRVHNGKAKIDHERCIDCGECIRNCTHQAKKSKYDSLDDIKKYKFKVALPAPALFAQFDNTVGAMFSNAFNLALQNPSATAVIAACNALLPALFLFLPGLFGYALYLWMMIGHAVLCRIVCRKLLPVFRELMPEEEPEPDEEITDDE